MCEFEKRLIAWMDCETEAVETLEIERHLGVCTACSARASKYREVSRSFADYCGAIASRKNSRPLLWAAFSAAAVLTATAAMVMLMLFPRVDPLPIQRPAFAEAPAMALRTAPVNPAAPAKLIRRRLRAKRAEMPQAAWSLEPSIEIAIPIEAVFAPGAVPPGFSFAAELGIANDGSSRGLWLRP
jgi:predicted anti-sigma-YlaC factor YlaD